MSHAVSSEAYPLRLRLLIGAVLAAAVPVVAGAGFTIATDRTELASLAGAAVFLLLAFLADLKPVPLDESGDRPISLAFIFILAAQILFGWEYAVVTAALSVLPPQLIERRPPTRVAFNTGVYALAAFASSLPAVFLPRVPAESTLNVASWTFLGGVAFVSVNFLLICLVVAFWSGQPFSALLRDNVRHGGPAFLTMAFFSAIAVVLWNTQPGLLVLLAGPLAALTLYQRSSWPR